ncbi:LacI family DNA-binding transcriptional regulator [Bifidobacterium amazonense]|uniref:LacI family DNA-binding transcriptional regulator n=3 Tax=Bifidobacterium TaxID=1678 RepID=A0ABS9VUF2_9BIFI|nr:MULTISPECIES: LacI family DNA-binding transcriptional regulator [Bifidobacterium]MBT1173313.1 LacI family DNA-binding transcriptional regulator [Bifidobacterium santillanense]MBT1174097.1 LacI family DNA-binding transcriptional regulator [Bifidobacterium colobi]MCH9275727.1 LacI family DNA-binding transcriptional regulator [Bifidobacterium amazonense]
MAVQRIADPASENSRERKNGKRSSVTLKDVAAAAGTSVSTVSLVMNHKPGARIGKDARARVLKAIDELGYRPNTLAQGLARGRSNFIGLVADSIATTPFAGQIIHGAQEEAWKRGYVLLIANTEGDRDLERRAIEEFMEHNVSGVIYSTWYHHEITMPPELTQVTTVLVNCSDPNSEVTAVVPDEFRGGKAAAQMLIDAGHRRIAFVNSTSISPARTGRRAGYLAALEEAGIPADESLMFDTMPYQEGGMRIAEQVVQTGATGVCCHNDRVAMGLYDALRDRGLRIPDDLSVVGFDNQEVIAAHMSPPLSTVQLPHYELGVVGVKMLLEDVESPDRAGFSRTIRIDCPPVMRDSIRRL